MRMSLHCLLHLGIIVAALVSCEHRPLADPLDACYVRVYIEEEIKNVTFGFYNDTYRRPNYERPNTVRVVLADPESGAVVSERYLQHQGTDSVGYYIDGYINAPPGTYNMLLYSFGSPHTLIRNEWNYYTMQGYTNPVSDYYLQYLPAVRNSMDVQDIVQQPEHMFHDVVERIVVHRSPEPDTLRSTDGNYFKAHSIVKSYYIQIRVKGIQWATSAVSVLSGMAGATLMHKHGGLVASDSVHVLFAMTPTEKMRSATDGSTTATLYTTFNTFGKLPEIPSRLAVTFEFMKRDGSSQTEEIDITEMFNTPQVRDQQWILIDHEIELSPPEGDPMGGGMTPGVDDWNDIESEMYL